MARGYFLGRRSQALTILLLLATASTARAALTAKDGGFNSKDTQQCKTILERKGSLEKRFRAVPNAKVSDKTAAVIGRRVNYFNSKNQKVKVGFTCYFRGSSMKGGATFNPALPPSCFAYGPGGAVQAESNCQDGPLVQLPPQFQKFVQSVPIAAPKPRKTAACKNTCKDFAFSKIKAEERSTLLEHHDQIQGWEFTFDGQQQYCRCSKMPSQLKNESCLSASGGKASKKACDFGTSLVKFEALPGGSKPATQHKGCTDKCQLTNTNAVNPNEFDPAQIKNIRGYLRLNRQGEKYCYCNPTIMEPKGLNFACISLEGAAKGSLDATCAPLNPGRTTIRLAKATKQEDKNKAKDRKIAEGKAKDKKDKDPKVADSKKSGSKPGDKPDDKPGVAASAATGTPGSDPQETELERLKRENDEKLKLARTHADVETTRAGDPKGSEPARIANASLAKREAASAAAERAIKLDTELKKDLPEMDRLIEQKKGNVERANAAHLADPEKFPAEKVIAEKEGLKNFEDIRAKRIAERDTAVAEARKTTSDANEFDKKAGLASGDTGSSDTGTEVADGDTKPGDGKTSGDRGEGEKAPGKGDGDDPALAEAGADDSEKPEGVDTHREDTGSSEPREVTVGVKQAGDDNEGTLSYSNDPCNGSQKAQIAKDAVTRYKDAHGGQSPVSRDELMIWLTGPEGKASGFNQEEIESKYGCRAEQSTIAGLDFTNQIVQFGLSAAAGAAAGAAAAKTQDTFAENPQDQANVQKAALKNMGEALENTGYAQLTASVAQLGMSMVGLVIKEKQTNRANETAKIYKGSSEVQEDLAKKDGTFGTYSYSGLANELGRAKAGTSAAQANAEGEEEAKAGIDGHKQTAEKAKAFQLAAMMNALVNAQAGAQNVSEGRALKKAADAITGPQLDPTNPIVAAPPETDGGDNFTPPPGFGSSDNGAPAEFAAEEAEAENDEDAGGAPLPPALANGGRTAGGLRGGVAGGDGGGQLAPSKADGGGGGGGGGLPGGGGGGGGDAPEKPSSADMLAEGATGKFEAGGGGAAAAFGPAGGGKGGNRVEDTGMDVNGLLAQFLPKNEEANGPSGNSILDYDGKKGGRRGLAGGGSDDGSILGPHANLFLRISQTTMERYKRGQLR